MAVVAFGGVFLLASTLGGGGGGGPTTKAVVAKQDIPLRHVITDGDLDIANVSGNFGTLIYANKTDVINLISQIKISKGSVITSDMLARDINIVSGGAGAPAYLPLAKGFVAMTIPTGEIQGVAGHISIGDYITVIASGSVSIFNPSGVQQGPVKVVAKTVFYNLRVIGLGPATAGVQPAGSTGGGGGSATTTGVTSSLTVVLSQCDAEYLRWFLNNMTITYTLESYKDLSLIHI